MSESRHMSRRLAAIAGTLASALALLLAVGGVGATNALATCSTTIEGQGSTTQQIPQFEIFAPAWASSGCGTGTNAKFNYVQTSDQKGLAEWGFLPYPGEGERHVVDTRISVIGTDEPPNRFKIEEAQRAAHGADVVVVPVTETAVAIVAHPPAECSFFQITNAHLNEAFAGAPSTWAELGATGSGCNTQISRVVRNEASAVTTQLKNYLSKVQGWDESKTEEFVEEQARSEYPACYPFGGGRKWSELEYIGAGERSNIEWPQCGSKKPLILASGDRTLAQRVAQTEGTIGYATLPAAKASGARILRVQDGTSGSKATYAEPSQGDGGANCNTAKYTVPPKGLPASGTGLDVDWSHVFGGNNPGVGGGSYSMCMLTYDLAWHSYGTAGFSASVGRQVRSYYEFILSNKLGSTPRYYENLPERTVEANNIQAAAAFAVSKIN